MNVGMGLGTGARTGRKTSTGRTTGRGTATRTTVGPQVAALRDAVALDLPPRARDDDEPPPLDEDDAPAEEAYPELPREDDDGPAGADEDWADAMPRRLAPRPQLVLWMSAEGIPQLRVAEPAEELLLDPDLSLGAIKRHAVLVAYGEYMCRYARAVIAAGTLAEAFDALVPTPAAAVAGALSADRTLQVDPARLSEDNGMLVRLPSGLVPLSFFTCKQANDAYVVYLWRQPDLLKASNTALARRAEAERGWGHDAVERYINWLRAVRQAPGVVRTAAARFGADPRDADAQEAALARALTRAVAREAKPRMPKAGRGKAVLQRALYGGLS